MPDGQTPFTEQFEAEIERQLTIPRMVIRTKDSWVGYVRASEISELSSASPMEQKHWLFSSMLEQQIDLLLDIAQQNNHYLRMLEAAIIRARLQRERDVEKEIGLRNMWKFLRWFGLLAGAAIIAFFAKKWLGVLSP
jgi:hypothetical protein